MIYPEYLELCLIFTDIRHITLPTNLALPIFV